MPGLTAKDEQLRREGMVDALAMLAMRGSKRGVTVERLAGELGERFDEAEIRRALLRWKARYAERNGAGPAAVRAILDGRSLRPVPTVASRPGKRQQKPRGPRVLTCRWCDQPFEHLPVTGHPPAFCSPDHRRLAHNEAQRERSRAKRTAEQ